MHERGVPVAVKSVALRQAVAAAKKSLASSSARSSTMDSRSGAAGCSAPCMGMLLVIRLEEGELEEGEEEDILLGRQRSGMMSTRRAIGGMGFVNPV